MFIVIGIMLAGILTGYLLQHKRLEGIHKVITLLIWILLFLLGIDVGSNKTILNELHTIGADAAIITSGAVIGSALFAWLWYILYKRHKKAIR